MGISFDTALLLKGVGGLVEKGLAALLSAVIAWTGGGQTFLEVLGDRPVKTTRQEYVFDNDRLLISAWNHGDAQEETVRLAKEAGLDFMLSVVGGRDTVNDTLALFKKYDLGVMQLDYGHTYLLDVIDPAYHDYFWGELKADEPAAHDMESALADELQAHFDAYNEKGLFSLINLLPNYGSPEALSKNSDVSVARYITLFQSPWARRNMVVYPRYLATFVSRLNTDYISTDTYPFSVDHEKGTVVTYDKWLYSLAVQAEACRETGRDMWVITQAGGDYIKQQNRFVTSTLPEQNQQHFASLAFGTKNIMHANFKNGWFQVGGDMLYGATNEPTPTYYAVQAANKELAPFAKIYGEYKWNNAYLENKTRCAGIDYKFFGLDFLPNKIYGIPNPLPVDERLKLITKDGLLIGKFDKIEGDGNAWIITNMMDIADLKTAEFTVRFEASTTVYLGGETKVYEAGDHTFTLDPGQGMFVTM
jgi:hypothetical protein